MADKIDAEIDRIRKLLVETLEVNRFSIRELERKAQVTQGLFRKPLGGDMRLTYHHVLQMVDAVGLPWTTFFRAAYPLRGETAPPLKLGDTDPNPVVAEPAPEIQASASEADSSEGRRILITLCRELIRLGKLEVRDLFDEDSSPYPNSM